MSWIWCGLSFVFAGYGLKCWPGHQSSDVRSCLRTVKGKNKRKGTSDGEVHVGDVEDTEDDTQEEKGIGKDNEQETKWFHSKLQWNKAKPKLIWSKTAYSVISVLYGANNVDTTPSPGGWFFKKIRTGMLKVELKFRPSLYLEKRDFVTHLYTIFLEKAPNLGQIGCFFS